MYIERILNTTTGQNYLEIAVHYETQQKDDYSSKTKTKIILLRDIIANLISLCSLDFLREEKPTLTVFVFNLKFLQTKKRPV